METGGKEPLKTRLIEIYIPNLTWLDFRPPQRIPFGNHIATFSGSTFEKPCNGDFFLFEGNNTGLEDLRGKIGIHCLKCNTTLPFSFEGWQKFMLQWMIIVAATNLNRIQDASNKITDTHNIFSIIRDEVKICKTKNLPIPLAQEIYKHFPFRDDAHRGLGIYNGNTYWEHYQMVTRITDLNEGKHNLLHIIEMIIATKIEKSLQQGINQAAQFACSASEKFHPDTRGRR